MHPYLTKSSKWSRNPWKSSLHNKYKNFSTGHLGRKIEEMVPMQNFFWKLIRCRTKPENYYVCRNPEAQSYHQVASPYCMIGKNLPKHASCT